jgi:anti-sigma factor (TIGR02949 family)
MKLIKVWDSNCTKIVALLDHYLSNELTVASTEEVVEHLVNCPQCLEKFKFRKRVRNKMRESIENEKAPPGLRMRVLQLLRKERDSRVLRTFYDPNEF